MPADFYKTLSVAKNASVDEIKKAYRKLARQYHPDRNQGNKQAEERFKEIQEAYSVLSDKDKRKQFDSGGMFGFGGGDGQGGFRFDPSMFRQGAAGGGFGVLLSGTVRTRDHKVELFENAVWVIERTVREDVHLGSGEDRYPFDGTVQLPDLGHMSHQRFDVEAVTTPCGGVIGDRHGVETPFPSRQRDLLDRPLSIGGDRVRMKVRPNVVELDEARKPMISRCVELSSIFP